MAKFYNNKSEATLFKKTVKKNCQKLKDEVYIV